MKNFLHTIRSWFYDFPPLEPINTSCTHEGSSSCSVAFNPNLDDPIILDRRGTV